MPALTASYEDGMLTSSEACLSLLASTQVWESILEGPS